MGLPANPRATKFEPVCFLPQKDTSIHIVTDVSLQVIPRPYCHNLPSPRMAQTQEIVTRAGLSTHSALRVRLVAGSQLCPLRELVRLRNRVKRPIS